MNWPATMGTGTSPNTVPERMKFSLGRSKKNNTVWVWFVTSVQRPQQQQRAEQVATIVKPAYTTS